jgi:DinB superfamily
MTNYVPGRPDPAEYAPGFQGYIDRAKSEDDIIAALTTQVDELRALVGGLDAATAGHRYAEGKWTIREVIGHVADAERVFGYRAMCIARGETTSLPGFDENVYAANSPADSRPLADLLDEFTELRSSNVRMLRALTPESWTRGGTANGKPVTARAIAYVLLGHGRHHMAVLRERYLG